jgi:hypothetical protein
MLKYMAAEFLLEYTTVPEVLYIRKTKALYRMKMDIYWCDYFSSFSARFTLFLYLGKMFAQAVKKPHWQKVVRVTLELTPWILSRNSLLVPREVIALTSLVHLPTPWRGINICREEYHYWRQVLQQLLLTIITHWAWMCHPIFLLLRRFLSCSICYRHQRPLELLLNRTLLQGTCWHSMHICDLILSVVKRGFFFKKNWSCLLLPGQKSKHIS